MEPMSTKCERSYCRTLKLSSCGALALLLVSVAAASARPTARATPARAQASDCSKGDATGITKDQILLGHTTVATGEAGFVGQENDKGLNLVFKQVNAAGGIEGRKIKSIGYDDTYDTSKAQQGARRLVESNHIFAWVGGNGTPTLLAVMPYLQQQKVPIVADYGPSDSIGTMANPFVFNIWTNFTQEYEVLTDYVITHAGAGKANAPMAFLRYNISLGADALKGTQAALARHHLKLTDVLQTTTTNTDWASVAVNLKKTGAKWVGIQVSETQGGQLLQAMHRIGYRPHVFGESDFVDASFGTTFGKDTDGFYAALKLRPATDKYPAWQKIRANYLKATGKPMTSWNATGYAQGMLAVQALKTMKAPTRECFMEALQNVKNYDIGILPPISFGANVRQGVQGVGVAQWNNKKLVQILPFTKF
jgi:ABC-type branched-subunit amino acid transport system substrate-binding protein